MPKRRIKKKELKSPDEFSIWLRRVSSAILSRKKELILGASLIILLLISALLIKHIRVKRITEANLEFTRVMNSGNPAVLESFSKRFSKTSLGKLVALAYVENLLEMGKTKEAEKALERTGSLGLSKFSFITKISRKYLEGSIKAKTDPKGALPYFSDISEGKTPYLKPLADLRRATILYVLGSPGAKSAYENLMLKKEISGNLLKNICQEILLTLKTEEGVDHEKSTAGK